MTEETAMHPTPARAAPPPPVSHAATAADLQLPQNQTSHTSDNPVQAPHTKAGQSVPASPEPYVRLFLLLAAARYIPRGIFQELFDGSTFRAVKEPINKLIDSTFLKRQVRQIEKIVAESPELARAAKHDVALLKQEGEASALYTKLRKVVRHWRGDASDLVPHVIEGLNEEKGVLSVSDASQRRLRDTIRGRMGDMLYSTSLFAGSTWLTLNYSKQVRRDIQNLFCETVALEKGIPPEQVTFADVARSDNAIIRHTIENYHSKRNGRLFNGSLFLGAAALKSGPLTDVVFGWNGWQIYRDTQKRNPSMFEDLITFVNNKINPINGLGQPVSMGEVFDLYQHYAQAYAPANAFVGVIEHAKGEGARWAENQIIFQRMTELLNKTYAYKHKSIVDPQTGLTVLQADFALPKFIYLLGHDLIDVHKPEQTLTTIEVANRYGIEAVKQMQQMLQGGKSLADVTARYPVSLPTPAPQPVGHEASGLSPKNPNQQLDAAAVQPVSRIELSSLQGDGQMQATPRAPALI